MQHAPDVDVIVALNMEDEIRITGQRPVAQARQVQLMGVAGCTRGGMASDVNVGLLQRFDEAQRGLLRASLEVVLYGLIGISVGHLTQDDGFGLQPRARQLTRTRSASK